MDSFGPGRAGRSAWWPLAIAVQMACICGLGAWFAFGWSPAPASDWLLYWNTAGDARGYERGGVGLWLLALPKQLGMAPHAAAFSLNLPAAVWLGCLAHHVDSTRWRVFAHLVVAYLVLLTPYLGIVQLDLAGTAALVSGVWLLLDGAQPPSRRRLALAILALTIAVSTRPQFALILWALVTLLAMAMLPGRQWRRGPLVLVMVGLLLGSSAGFLLDMGLRRLSGNTEQIRTSSAVTLYAGLLASSSEREAGCGHWSVEAARAARDDLGMPMTEAIGQRLASRPVAHWADVLACKWPQIVMPPAFAFYWFAEAPNLVAWRESHPDRPGIERLQAIVYHVERLVYRTICTLIILFSVISAAKALFERRWVPPLLVAGWVAAFWAVHAVFEIQGRYFLGFYLVLAFLGALVWRLRTPPARRDPAPLTAD